MQEILLVMRRLLRRAFSRWPRRFVLRDTGEPVELLYIEEEGLARRFVVALRDGREFLITPDELVARPMFPSTAVPASIALVLALVVAGYSTAEPSRAEPAALACTGTQLAAR